MALKMWGSFWVAVVAARVKKTESSVIGKVWRYMVRLLGVGSAGPLPVCEEGARFWRLNLRCTGQSRKSRQMRNQPSSLQRVFAPNL